MKPIYLDNARTFLRKKPSGKNYLLRQKVNQKLSIIKEE